MRWPEWKPARALIDLEQELEKTFSSLIHEPWEDAAEAPAWCPAIDVEETDEEYLVTADLPGVTWTRLQLQVEAHRIVLRGERAATRRTHSANRVHGERICGRFTRRINLDHPVKPKSATSEMENGILHIRVQKLQHHNAEDEES